ncbi:F-box domain-containing protein [Heracleum sosnowskyi]|uniref:F-box domain-containing protein n=1 Tax=Heracleum sosnowskyi TaxID=360622 RepID=A0AAD8N9Q9_9APIA|nr:F-box domain-containing protein [Heracleum sosnowskyi]
MARTTANCLVFCNKKRSIYNSQLSVIDTKFLDRGISYLDFPSNLGKPCHIVGSCNGLLCVAYERSKKQTGKRLYLWNPATGKVKHIPENTNVNNIDIYDVSIGFCFDFSSSDYKVVRIVKEDGFASERSRVVMYSLIKNYWKEIKVELNFKVIDYICPAIVKGSIYWIIVLLDQEQFALLSFNVKSEIFRTISLPGSIMCRQDTSYICLFEFKESVALIDEKDDEDISIWTLDDDSCWIKKFTISSPSLITEIVGCLKTGEFVGTNFVETDLAGTNFAGDIVLYDSVNNMVENTLFKLAAPRTYNYSESLVNLNYSSRSFPKKGTPIQLLKTRTRSGSLVSANSFKVWYQD